MFSRREKPPADALAPKARLVGDNSLITDTEWRYFYRLCMAALAQNKSYVPYIEKSRVEYGIYVPIVRRWNSERLINWQSEGPHKGGLPLRQFYPKGVSASLRSEQLYVWTGKASFTAYGSADNKTKQVGVWNAELRGMIQAIEAGLPRAILLTL